MGLGGRLDDAEVFVLTDNAVFEGTFHKGHSSSKKLNDIILRLRMLEMKTGSILHVIHIAGTRMKEAGIDGLSRGDLLEGMMKGAHPLEFIPLDEDAAERAGPSLENWISSWWEDEKNLPWCGASLVRLNPEDWFNLPNIAGPRLWIPPPAAMETIVELFSEDRLTNPHIPHVFAVPRLMTYLWRKALSKDADVVFSIRAGSSFWPSSMHEPLIVLIVLPLTHVENYRGPWTRRGSPEVNRLKNALEAGFRDPELHGSRKFHDVEGPVRGVRDPKEEWSRTLLFEFLEEQKRFPPVSGCLVREMLPVTPRGPFSSPRKTRQGGKRRSGNRGGTGQEVPDCKRRRSSDGNSV